MTTTGQGLKLTQGADLGSDYMRRNGIRKELEVVKIDDLNVDHTYQRALDQGLVERILQDFDPIAADAIVVSRRADGSLWVVNGQHRAAAEKLAGEEETLAFVYEGLTPEREADLRLKAGNSRQDTALERFYAQITAQKPHALALRDLLAEYGAQVNKVANQHTGVNCVGTVEKLFARDEMMLRRALKAVTEAYGEVKGPAAQSAVLQGLWWFFGAHEDEYQWRQLVERLEQHPPDELLRKARSHKAINGGPDWLNLYRALVEVYNHRRQEHSKLETRTKNWGQAPRSRGAS